MLVLLLVLLVPLPHTLLCMTWLLMGVGAHGACFAAQRVSLCGAPPALVCLMCVPAGGPLYLLVGLELQLALGQAAHSLLVEQWLHLQRALRG